ncbi:hypothetical protein ATKI12_3843 [Kitasatospora sp. Ki12]
MNEYDGELPDGELPTPDQAFSTALNRLLDLDRPDLDRLLDLDRLIPRPSIPRQRGSSTGHRVAEPVPGGERRRRTPSPPLPPRTTGEAYAPPVTASVPPPAGRVIPPVRAGHCSAGRIPCDATGARLYPGGWFCDDHRP